MAGTSPAMTENDMEISDFHVEAAKLRIVSLRGRNFLSEN
jgi:hypothetical protein